MLGDVEPGHAPGDAVLLSADLLHSQPAASGTTAFDRLAKSRANAPEAEEVAITALRKARFRLLRLEEDAAMRDVVSDEVLRVVEEAKTSGLIARAIERIGVRSVFVAPHAD